MSEDYKIECPCGNSHIPIWGKSGTPGLYIFTPEKISVPYTCPIDGKKYDATYPYNRDIDGKSIVGWK